MTHRKKIYSHNKWTDNNGVQLAIIDDRYIISYRRIDVEHK